MTVLAACSGLLAGCGVGGSSLDTNPGATRIPSLIARRNVSTRVYPGGSVRSVRVRGQDQMGSFARHAEYYENGRPLMRGAFREGLPDGEWVRYYPNGERMATGSYDRGRKIGFWNYWTSRGRLKRQEYFRPDGRKLVTITEDHRESLDLAWLGSSFECILLRDAKLWWGMSAAQLAAMNPGLKPAQGVALDFAPGLASVEFRGSASKPEAIEWVAVLSRRHGMPSQQTEREGLFSTVTRYRWTAGTYTIDWLVTSGLFGAEDKIRYELVSG